jgi:hypothetical protein
MKSRKWFLLITTLTIGIGCLQASGELDVKASLTKRAEHNLIGKLPRKDWELTAYLRDTRWNFGGDKILTLSGDGTTSKTWGKRHLKWDIKDMHLYYEQKVFRFSDDFRAIELIVEESAGADCAKLKTGVLIEK